MSDQDQQKAEELLQGASEQRRHETEPTSSNEADDDEVDEPGDLAAAVANAYHQLDAEDLHQNLTVRDADLAALVAGLEDVGELADVAARANDRLDRDADAESRADLLKALLRVGLDEVAPEAVDDAKEGKREFLASQADDF